MNEITHYNNTTIDDIKRQLLNEASSILTQLDRLYQIQKVLLTKIASEIINDDVEHYKTNLEKYQIVSSLINNLQKQKKNSLNDLRPIAELNKSDSMQTTKSLPILNIIG